MSIRNLGPLVRHAAFLGVGGLLLASSCILDRAGGRAVEGGGGAGNTGGTGGEGGGQCNTIDDCDDPPTQCIEKSCVGGWCGLHELVQGSTCYVDGQARVCDGQGNCVKGRGSDCVDGDECLSSHCVDGVCCDTACDGDCESCSKPMPQLGTCSPHGAGSDLEGDCGTGTCDGVSGCAEGGHVFSKSWGISGEPWPMALAVGPDNAIVLGGHFDGEINLDGGLLSSANHDDGFVVKYEADRSHAWDGTYGEADWEYVTGVAVDSEGNVFVCGHHDGDLDIGDGNGLQPSVGDYDIFLVKLDPNGGFLWGKRFGNFLSQTCHGLAVDSLSNVIMIAQLHGMHDFGTGTDLYGQGAGDVVLAKYDKDGTPQWAKRFGDYTAQLPKAVAVDSSDRIVVVGDFHGDINFGGATLHAGFAGVSDIFVARFDLGGNHLFSKDYGDHGAEDRAEGLAIDGVHHIVLAGAFEGDIDLGSGTSHSAAGSTDGFVVRLDGSGEFKWERVFEADDSLWPRAVAIDSSNNIIVGGEYRGGADFGGGIETTHGGYDIFLAKYTYDGVPLWSHRYGEGSDQWLKALATNSDREIIATGRFEGALNFGGGDLPVSGTRLYLAVLAP